MFLLQNKTIRVGIISTFVWNLKTHLQIQTLLACVATGMLVPDLLCCGKAAREKWHFSSGEKWHLLRKIKEKIFLPHPITPGTGPLQTIPQSRARRAWLVPKVARSGDGKRSNWTMHKQFTCESCVTQDKNYHLNRVIPPWLSSTIFLFFVCPR